MILPSSLEALFHNPNPKEGDTPRLEIEITHRLMDVEKTWATAFGQNDPQSHGFAPPQTGDGAFDRTRGGPQRILMSQQFGGLLVDVYPVTHKEVWKFDFDMTKKKGRTRAKQHAGGRDHGRAA